MSDARVPMDPIFTAFGVPATVTRPAPDEMPIVTTGVWMHPLTETQSFGSDIRRFDPRWVFAVRTSAVPDARKGTLVETSGPNGGAIRMWQVDGYDSTEGDHLRLILKPTTH